MTQRTRLAVLASLLLGFSSLGAVGASAQMAEERFGIQPQNNSDLHGTVTLVAMGSETKVTIELAMMNGAPAVGMPAMPAHVHMGTCADLNPAPQFPLASVVDGKSETVVNASVETIMASPHAVNIHKSAQAVSTYVACGDLAMSNQMMMSAGAMTGGAMPANQGQMAQGQTMAGGTMLPQGQMMPSGQGQMAQGPAMPAPGKMMAGGAMAGQGQMTQMPKGMMAGGAMMPTSMPRTGDVPLAPLAFLGLGAVAAGLVIRRRGR